MEQPEINNIQEKRFSIWRFLKRLILSLIIGLIGLTGITVALVFIYEDDVKALVIKELNKHLNAEVRIDPKNIDLTIVKSFPDCALEFKKLTVMEAIKSETKDTLAYAESVALAFNIKDLFDKNYAIKKILLTDAKAFLKVNKKGENNYTIWKTDTVQSPANDSLAFALEKISLKNVKVNYKNNKQKIKLSTTIDELHFKGQFENEDYTLITDGNAYVDVFQIEKIKYLNDKKIKFDIELDVQGNRYTIKKSESAINATQIVSNGSFVVKDSLLSLDVNFNGKNLDISSTLSLLPEKFQNQMHDYKSDGEFYANGEFHYSYNKPFELQSKFGIKNGTITYKPSDANLTNVNLSGSIEMNDKRTSLKLNDINAQLNNNTFSGNLELSNFKDPYLKLKATANTKLEELIAFYPIDTLQSVGGSINLNAEIEGFINELKSNTYSPNVKANGNAVITDIKAQFKQSDKEINIPEGELKLNNRHLNVYHLKLIKGNSDVMLVGEMPNFLSYLFDAKEPLTIIASVTSDKIELEDFLFKGSDNSSSTSSVSIANNLNLNVSTNIKHLTFGKFVADNISGNLLVKDQKAAVKDLVLNAMDGTIKLNAFADASGENIRVSGDGELNKLNIQKLFTQLNNFGQTTLQDKHLKGFVTANVDFTCAWDRYLKPDVNSINATSSLVIERGELNDFQPLESLAKYIDVEELRHIKFSTMQSAVEIKNKMITIPKTSIKSTAINMDLWGKHSFDNIIDYHIQLLLSEIISKRPRKNKEFDEELSLVENDPENRRSVFIVMSGPIDNPTIKYDRKGAKEKIKEDIKQEKQNLKNILKEEFGFFKKDTVKTKEQEKANQKFNIQFGEEKPKKTTNTLQPKKKEEEEDF